jgi:ribokinase
MCVERRPAPGETVGDAVLKLYPGGKGANQAVAAALCGASVEMVACVGPDPKGQARVRDLVSKGIGTARVRSTAGEPTGVAFITLTPDGENAITVAPGANAELTTDDVEEAGDLIEAAAVLVAQLEVPLAAVVQAAELAARETTFLLNCAPYRPLPNELLERVDILVVNESEAAGLLGRQFDGVQEAREAAAELCKLGPGCAVVTLGPEGAVVAAPDVDLHVPAPPVHVVDTTSAGDAFVGALAARLATGDSLIESVAFATVVGSATTERHGAGAVVPAELLAGASRVTSSWSAGTNP